MAKKNDVKISRGIRFEAEKVAMFGHAAEKGKPRTRRQQARTTRGKGGKGFSNKKFGAGATGGKTVGVKNPVTVVEIAESMASLAKAYSVAPHRPLNFGGGLKRLKGGSADPSYPYNRSRGGRFATGGLPRYSSLFTSEVKVKGNKVWAEIRNSSPAATFVEYGTQKGDREERISAGFGNVVARREADSVSVGRSNVNRRLFFKIPVKPGVGRKAKALQISYAAKKAKGYPSVDPEYIAWKRRQRQHEEGVKIRVDNPNLSRAQLNALRKKRGLLTQNKGSIRKRFKLVDPGPEPPSVVRSRGIRDEGQSFINNPQGGPEYFLFTRKVRQYPGYAIIRRAAVDAMRLHL